jgi:hypothetical protein
MSKTLKQITEEFQRAKLTELLSQCTPEQQGRFHSLVFPNGVPADQLPQAYALVERTIRRNEEGQP